MRFPGLPKRGLYFTAVPLILAGASLTLFVPASFVLGAWGAGWDAVLLVLLLSLETFFLPYLLAPIALRLPSLLPWTRYDPVVQFGIDGPGRLAQRLILAALIGIGGLPVLTGYGAELPAWAPAAIAIPAKMIIAGRGTVLVFAVLALALALPDFSPRRTDRRGPAR